MESENFGHEHPLLLLNGKQSSQLSDEAYCSRCGDDVSVPNPCYSCVENCGFYLHEKCDAPLRINHPFHPNHPLLLLPTLPDADEGDCLCNFCNQTCKRFVYHCSCNLKFHGRCALFSYNIADKNNLKEHVYLMNKGSSDFDTYECCACWEPIAADSAYFTNYRFDLHKKCAELSHKIDHGCHRKHPLILQFNSEKLSCQICKETQQSGFLYCCQSCKFAVHIRCVSTSPLPVIEDESHHPHPFTLFQRPIPFICDGCGSQGNYVAYVCSACSIMLHDICTSLPRIIRSRWHDHPIFHKYFIRGEDFKSWDCIICHTEVNIEHGSYSCLDCKIIFHVNCVKQYPYEVVNEGEKSSDTVESFTCIRRNDAGEVIEIKHIEHRHNLILSDKIVEYDKCCDGCLLPILVPFYYCSLCDFYLHKACAELSRKKQFWFHDCKQPVILQNYSDYIFECFSCYRDSNGFAYKCTECERQGCLQCVIALTPGALTCLGHKHSLFFYNDHYEGKCGGCDENLEVPFRCKVCNFTLCFGCFVLPIRARHKCDKHLLTLTYHDDNDYLKYHYCDICEEKRDPNHWFYHCAPCDNSAHPHCVIGEYSFIKSGSMCQKTNDHPHPLTFVRKIYYYPNCIKCDKPCQDLALECTTSGCNYIIHWECFSAS